MAAPVIASLEPAHRDALRAFLDRLPDGDVTFIKEDVRSPAVADQWLRAGAGARYAVGLGSAGEVLGLVSIRPLVGWSNHVGELRLVVDPAHRGHGLGRGLARHALREAIDSELQKIVVEVVAEQEGAIQMFADLGFRGEALLENHIRDRSGQLRDLLVLAHDTSTQWSAMAAVGVDGEV